jgi:hypothetical protein
MRTRFDWQVGNDDGQWETIAQTGGDASRARRHRALQWIGMVSLAAIVIATTWGYAIIRRRYEQASKQIAFQIQSVIDLEANAFSAEDRELLLAQQDEPFAPAFAEQTQSFMRRGGRFFMPPVAVLPAKVEDVNLQGDVAWVQVIEGEPPVRRVRFYRQTELGWLHTTPVPAFWDDTIEYQDGEQLVFYFHERDQPYIDPMVEQLGEAFYALCAAVGCNEDERFEILFYPAPAGRDIQADLVFPSPWLSGIPIDSGGQDADDPYWSERDLEAALAALESRVMAWATGGDVMGPFSRDPALVTARWLDLVPITPEMFNLGMVSFGRGGAFRNRFEAPRRNGTPFPDA